MTKTLKKTTLPRLRFFKPTTWRSWNKRKRCFWVNEKFQMNHPLPRTAIEWLNEIKLAIADASEAIPFGQAIGQPITDANLFHLAPDRKSVV